MFERRGSNECESTSRNADGSGRFLSIGNASHARHMATFLMKTRVTLLRVVRFTPKADVCSATGDVR